VSQHIFNTKDSQGKSVTVTMGYDRSLNYIFCTVTADGGEVVYSNLRDKNAGTRQQSVDYFRPILENLGLVVPESVYREVESDQIQRVGNRFVVHPAGE
jgi:hypothetical protein